MLPKYYCGLQNQVFFASLSFLLALALRLSGVNRKEFALNDINAFFGRGFGKIEKYKQRIMFDLTQHFGADFIKNVS